MMGVLQFKTNEMLDADAQAEDLRRASELKQAEPLILGLAAHVRRCWDAAKDAKAAVGANGASIKDRINDAIRRRRGIYDATTEQVIRQNGPSKCFLKLTDEKCHAAKAWLIEAMMPAGDKPWSAEPTTDPTLPPQEMQRVQMQAGQQAEREYAPMLQMMGWQPGMPLPPQIQQAVEAMGAELRQQAEDQLKKDARKAADEVEEAILDAMQEGGWQEALVEFIDDMVTYPTAFLKGPTWVSGRHMEWDQIGQPVVSTKLKLTFSRVDPNNAYPSPRATSVSDGYFIERHVLSRQTLRGLIGVEGYDDEAIKMCLEESGEGSLSDWLGLMDETERKRLLDQSQADRDPEGRIDALQFWGWVQGQQLIDYGIDAERVTDPLEEYHAEVWLVGPHVIKAELNGDPLGRRPYHAASYRPRPGSVWGEGIPEIIADLQDLCNATVRALENNLSWGSGPQVGVDISAMPEGENITELFPSKIWQFDLSRSASSKTPLWFFQPELRTQELLKTYEFFSAEADNKTGIPRYAYGQSQQGGPLGTASGYSMMLQNMSKAIGAVIMSLDVQVLQPIVRMTFQTLLLDGGLEYAGDIDIQCKGSKAILEKNNLMMRRQEFIQAAMQSPVVQQLLGMEGFAAILRAHVRDLAIEADDAIPTPEAIRRKEEIAQAQQMMQQQMMQMQVAMGGMMPPGGQGGPGGPGGAPMTPAPGGPGPAPGGGPGPLMGQLASQATHPGEDKIVAHISPEEAALLKRRGGAGTINPRTGLPEFWSDGGRDTSSGSEGTNGEGGSRRGGDSGSDDGGGWGGGVGMGRTNADMTRGLGAFDSQGNSWGTQMADARGWGLGSPQGREAISDFNPDKGWVSGLDDRGYGAIQTGFQRGNIGDFGGTWGDLVRLGSLTGTYTGTGWKDALNVAGGLAFGAAVPGGGVGAFAGNQVADAINRSALRGMSAQPSAPSQQASQQSSQPSSGGYTGGSYSPGGYGGGYGGGFSYGGQDTGYGGYGGNRGYNGQGYGALSLMGPDFLGMQSTADSLTAWNERHQEAANQQAEAQRQAQAQQAAQQQQQVQAPDLQQQQAAVPMTPLQADAAKRQQTTQDLVAWMNSRRAQDALAAQATHPGEDTMVAHISPQQAAYLKKRGGAGTINPRTGLPEFWTGGGTGGERDSYDSGGHGGFSGGGDTSSAGGGHDGGGWGTGVGYGRTNADITRGFGGYGGYGSLTGSAAADARGWGMGADMGLSNADVTRAVQSQGWGALQNAMQSGYGLRPDALTDARGWGMSVGDAISQSGGGYGYNSDPYGMQGFMSGPSSAFANSVFGTSPLSQQPGLGNYGIMDGYTGWGYSWGQPQQGVINLGQPQAYGPFGPSNNPFGIMQNGQKRPFSTDDEANLFHRSLLSSPRYAGKPVGEVIRTYVGKVDPNLQEQYIRNVETWTGLNRNDVLDPNNKEMMDKMQAGIMRQESGGDWHAHFGGKS